MAGREVSRVPLHMETFWKFDIKEEGEGFLMLNLNITQARRQTAG